MTIERDVIDELFKLDDNELYARLGAAVSGSHAIPPSPRKLVEIGKGWLAANLDRVAEEVCGNSDIRRYAAKEPGTVDWYLVVGILTDAIGATGGLAAAAILILRKGLHSLCAVAWMSE